MASFQANIGWRRLRKRKNKIYPSVSFLPDPELKIQKSSKKIQKIKKYDYGIISSQNSLEKIEKKRK